MQCAGVINITVKSEKDKGELYAGSQALTRKYTERGYGEWGGNKLFVNIYVDDKSKLAETIAQGVQSRLELLLELLEKKQHLGLYWSVHGNMTLTEPPLDQLAAQTCALYEKKLRFKKINLSACWGAGPEQENSKAKEFDYSTSVLSQFCVKLSSQMHDKKPLDGVMVAGYQALIVMYDSKGKEEYFKNLQADPKTNRISPALTGVRNSFAKFGNTNSFVETHPQFKPQDVEIYKQQAPRLARFKELDGIANKKGKEITEFKALKADPLIEKTAKACEMFQRYMMQKWVLCYSAGDDKWRRVPLAEYTDNASIKEMVALVPNPKIPDEQFALFVPK